MPKPTVTTGPLHFEDLEPHRFEDLTRRLIYDFRSWRELQATGRSGSDDGFDTRGIEISVNINNDAIYDSSNEEELIKEALANEKIWLIQCKREKSIGPKKLLQYLSDLPSEEVKNLYGLIFVAACDFSKTARDDFRNKIQEMGLQEAYLWGKGELEDMLYQPKNDDILFTFFGISNRIRHQTVATNVRRQLAVKRKAKRILEEKIQEFVLIRDAEDVRYPYMDTENLKNARRWSLFRFEGCAHDGLLFLKIRCVAFVGDKEDWDYAERMDDSRSSDNPWLTEEQKEQIKEYAEARAKAMEVWQAFPSQNKGWYDEYFVLPYENVIDIDEYGDDWFEGPHIYIKETDHTLGAFRDYYRIKLESIHSWDGRSVEPNPLTRIRKFDRDEELDVLK